VPAAGWAGLQLALEREVVGLLPAREKQPHFYQKPKAVYNQSISDEPAISHFQEYFLRELN
jgi:hypothetical protein